MLPRTTLRLLIRKLKQKEENLGLGPEVDEYQERDVTYPQAHFDRGPRRIPLPDALIGVREVLEVAVNSLPHR